MTELTHLALTPLQSRSLAALISEYQFPGSPHDQQLISQTLGHLERGESIPLTHGATWSLANMFFQKEGPIQDELSSVKEVLFKTWEARERIERDRTYLTDEQRTTLLAEIPELAEHINGNWLDLSDRTPLVAILNTYASSVDLENAIPEHLADVVRRVEATYNDFEYDEVQADIAADTLGDADATAEDLDDIQDDATLSANVLIPMPNDETQISDIAATIRGASASFIDWEIYENEVFAQVFEFKEHRRLQVWDEAEEIGMQDHIGYSWQEDVWSGNEWVEVDSAGADVPRSAEELVDRLRTFRGEAEATRPEQLTPTEAALDRMARKALGDAAAATRTTRKLEGRLRDTTRALEDEQQSTWKIRTALISLAKRLTPTGASATSNPPAMPPAPQRPSGLDL